jgi:preprotein translocase subunit SecA
MPKMGSLEAGASRALAPFARRFQEYRCRRTNLIWHVARQGTHLEAMTDLALRETATQVRSRIRHEGLSLDVIALAFAIIRETASRTLGHRPFDVQLFGGWVLLNGCIAEMATGEGKTLTATLPAATAALAGVPVHIITVNDYLTARDAEAMAPIYRMLGLTVGAITHGLSPAARRAAYACDVTYCTNKELAFDYLRDRLALGRHPNRIQLELEHLYGDPRRLRQFVLRGLCFGIVDEADSALVDEARVPLIISGHGDVPERPVYETALSLAGKLTVHRDFELEQRERSVRLTAAGRALLETLAQSLPGIWRGPRRREELTSQALTALYLFLKDTHYLVNDGKIQIIDEYTGRILGDRSWEHGLHQMIELKEGVALTSMNNPLARITYQRFFRRYHWLAGMTGTGQEVTAELWDVYRLATVSVATNRPTRRTHQSGGMYLSSREKWNAIVARIASTHATGRPVLVGTRSVEASEHLSTLLNRANLPHQVLNARRHHEEAEIVAQAGVAGRITVATNMAGRGTDIALDPRVAERGGLHVLATERHESRRIDRQLYGRCARQGDLGSCETFTSLEDDLICTQTRRLYRMLARWFTPSRKAVPRWLAWLIIHQAQATAELLHARTRRDLLKSEEQLETDLAFSGRQE